MSIHADLPEVADIAAALGVCGGLACRFDVDVLERCDSTNTRLMVRAEAGAPSGTVIVAGQQTAGRGRRGRVWHSAPGDTLMFSLLWRFPRGTSLSGLSLTAGLAVIDALNALAAVSSSGPCTTPAQLKWPNDVLVGSRKLAGILTELVSGSAAGGTAAVIGIGLNRRLPVGLPDALRQQVATLDDFFQPLPGTATLLAHLLAALQARLEIFSRQGFAVLQADWCAHHAFQNQPVRLLGDEGPVREGICRGVDEEGRLLLETGNGVEHLLSGELSLRPLAGGV